MPVWEHFYARLSQNRQAQRKSQMTVRRSLVQFCVGLLLMGVTARAGAVTTGAGRLMAVQGSAPQKADPQTTPSPPPQQAYSLPPEKLAKAIALGRIRNILHFAYAFWGIAVLWLLLVTGVAAKMSAWSERVTRRRWVQGLVFFGVLIAVLTVANLPLDVFAHHVSLNYGISIQGWGSWLVDQGKALGLTLVIGAPVLLLFNLIVRVSARRYWLWCWAVGVMLLVLGMFVEPLFEPIFNEYEPLAKDNPALVAELERVVARTGTNIPPDRMYLMKASVKTNGLNAYVSGIGATKRVVVWDTTAGRIPNDEVMFVFGHESGHYVLRHIPKGIAGWALGMFFVFWACAGIAAWQVRRFGAGWHVGSLASRAGFVVLLLIVSVASFVLEPAGNAFSRHFEHEADVFGQEAIHGLVPDAQKTAVAGFNALGEAWLEDPAPSEFIEFWEYDHPSTKTRANFAAQYDPWVNGGGGEFLEK